MLPRGMGALNVEYWGEDFEQIYDMGWIIKIPRLKGLSKNMTIQELAVVEDQEEGLESRFKGNGLLWT